MLSVPGFVSAHSHAFQRALRGHAERSVTTSGTFWSWRHEMYGVARALTPESIYAWSLRAYRELASAGVVAVGEFHYVHHEADGTPYGERTLLADTVIRAALDAGLHIALLRVAYARGGLGVPLEDAQVRFGDASVDLVLADVDTLCARWRDDPRVRIGVAPHSVRAVPVEWLRAIGEHARVHALPLHIHVAEQQAEIDACVQEHGRRPVELLADLDMLNDRFCAVHATLLADHEARLLGAARANVCACPTTERDLGDGLADLAALRRAGVRLCVGADSHVLSDHIEEVRALETHERLRLRRRITFEPDEGRTLAEQLLLEGSVNGARALGWNVRAQGRTTTMRPRTRVCLDADPSLADVDDEHAPDALVFSGSRLRYETLDVDVRA